MKDKEKPKKEEDYPRSVGGSFVARKIIYKACLGIYFALTSQNFKITQRSLCGSVM